MNRKEYIREQQLHMAEFYTTTLIFLLTGINISNLNVHLHIENNFYRFHMRIELMHILWKYIFPLLSLYLS